MADVFKFTEDQQAALKLIGGMVRNVREFALRQDAVSIMLVNSAVLPSGDR